MALKIGKKKDTPADDWSDAALGADTGSTPVTEPADSFSDNIATDSAPPRKSLAPVMLAAGAVLLLTAIGLGVYFMFLNKPAQDAEAPIVVQQPGAPLTPGKIPVKAPGKTPVKKSPVIVATKPAQPVDDPDKIVVNPAPNVTMKVKPGRAGITTPGTTTPAVQSQFGKPPSMAPKPNQPKPIDIMRDGVAGQDGKGLPAGAAVPVVRPAGPVPAALMAQLKALWRDGAAAKQRGDKAGAKRAWQKMLKLRPGHPGVQEAIEKL